MMAVKLLLLLLLAAGPSWAEEQDITTTGEGTEKTTNSDCPTCGLDKNTTEDCPTCGLDYYIAGEGVEEKWIYVDSPRCCSDCTYVSRGWKCKEKTCLLNCPWASSSATRANFFLSLQTIKEIISTIVSMDFLSIVFS